MGSAYLTGRLRGERKDTGLQFEFFGVRHFVAGVGEDFEAVVLKGIVGRRDHETGGERADNVLRELSTSLALGLKRLPMRRNPAPDDLYNLYAITRRTHKLAPDVIHGHGSKGGLYARLPGIFNPRSGIIRAYTPHGGSFNFRPGSAIHRVYMKAEAFLERATDLYLFESAFIQNCFDFTQCF